MFCPVLTWQRRGFRVRSAAAVASTSLPALRDRSVGVKRGQNPNIGVEAAVSKLWGEKRTKPKHWGFPDYYPFTGGGERERERAAAAALRWPCRKEEKIWPFPGCLFTYSREKEGCRSRTRQGFRRENSEHGFMARERFFVNCQFVAHFNVSRRREIRSSVHSGQKCKVRKRVTGWVPLQQRRRIRAAFKFGINDAFDTWTLNPTLLDTPSSSFVDFWTKIHIPSHESWSSCKILKAIFLAETFVFRWKKIQNIF